MSEAHEAGLRAVRAMAPQDNHPGTVSELVEINLRAHVALLSQLAAAYGSAWADEDKVTVNMAIADSAALLKLRVVRIAGGFLKAEQGERSNG